MTSPEPAKRNPFIKNWRTKKKRTGTKNKGRRAVRSRTRTRKVSSIT